MNEQSSPDGIQKLIVALCPRHNKTWWNRGKERSSSKYLRAAPNDVLLQVAIWIWPPAF
jgi:hypothetical protein